MKMWNAAEEAKYKVQGIMLNLDNTLHGFTAMTCEQDAHDWAAQFKGTHITDVVMNIAEGQCVFPCKNFGWYGEKYLQKVENGQPVDYSRLQAQYEYYTKYGYDYLKWLSKALPEAGINMWLSIRMNDAHDRGAGKETSTLFSNYYHENPQNRRVLYHSRVDGYYDKCQNYAKEAVRKLYLGLMDEALDRYDVYGFQLEWQREIKLWHIGGEYRGTEILNQFMRDAKAIITKYEAKYGHKIKFSVQVAPDVMTNYEFGLDVVRWAAEGLIDMVVPKGRWATTCNEMPVAHWKSLLAPFNVELAPDIDHRIKCYGEKGGRTLHDIETYAGTAALYLSQGADKIQIYNLLVPMAHRFHDEDKIAEYDPDIYMSELFEGREKTDRGWWIAFTTMGSYEKLMTMNRKVIPTYNDVNPIWGLSRCRDVQLPKTLSTDNVAHILRIGMGDIPNGAKVTLKIAADVINADNPPIVYVNSQPCNFIGIGGGAKAYHTRYQMYCYEVPAEVHGDMFAVAEIQTPESMDVPGARVIMKIDYAEIYIEPTK